MLKKFVYSFVVVFLLCVCICPIASANNINDSTFEGGMVNETYLEEQSESLNIDPTCGEWGFFDNVNMTVSGLYEGTAISDYVNLLLKDEPSGNVVILQDGNIQTSGYLEDGMIVRVYHDEDQFSDYTVVNILPVPEPPKASLNTQNYSNNSRSSSSGLTLPLDNMNLSSDISSPFGYRHHPSSSIYKLHAGIDIYWDGISGTPIKAAYSGTATVAWNSGGYGHYVTIDHGSVNGENLKTLYGHMSSVAISNGQTVTQGQVIGYVGNTGVTTGPHLHFEVRTGSGSFYNCTPVDPVPYLSGAGNSATPTGGSPIGNYEYAAGSAGSVRVIGWAFDYDVPSTAISIHVYIGGIAGSPNAIGYDMGATNVYRSDVNNAHDIDGNHGFDYTIQTSKRGTQEVYVFAIDVGSGENTILGHKTVNIPTGDPIGSYDGAVGGTGTVRVYGWAFDYDVPSTAISIHVYIGGIAGSPNAIGYDMGVTTAYRSDVNSIYGINGNHGFDFTISTTKRGTQEVYVFAINQGSGSNKLLGYRTVDIS